MIVTVGVTQPPRFFANIATHCRSACPGKLLVPPFVVGERARFMLWNRNKRSMGLNFEDVADLECMLALVRVADVLIENFNPGIAARLGVGCEALRKINSRLIYRHISGFGQGGPYAPRVGFDLIVCGMSGLVSINGTAAGAVRGALILDSRTVVQRDQ